MELIALKCWLKLTKNVCKRLKTFQSIQHSCTDGFHPEMNGCSVFSTAYNNAKWWSAEKKRCPFKNYPIFIQAEALNGWFIPEGKDVESLQLHKFRTVVQILGEFGRKSANQFPCTFWCVWSTIHSYIWLDENVEQVWWWEMCCASNLVIFIRNDYVGCVVYFWTTPVIQ